MSDDVTHIITHPGSAHQDEFIATVLILAHESSPVVLHRRNPSADDLADPDVWVIDVGGEYAPDKRNFDHHQDPSLSTSFVLIARFFDVEDAMELAYPWWRYRDILDREGATAAADALDIEGDVGPLESPVESFVLHAFARQSRLEEGHWLMELMRRFGQNLIRRSREIVDRMEDIRYRGEVRTVQGVRVLFYDDVIDAAASTHYRDTLDEPYMVTVSRARRTDGYKLYRYDEGADTIDFRRLRDEEGVVFTHNNGFLAVIEQDCDPARYVAQAIRGQHAGTEAAAS